MLRIGSRSAVLRRVERRSVQRANRLARRSFQPCTGSIRDLVDNGHETAQLSTTQESAPTPRNAKRRACTRRYIRSTPSITPQNDNSTTLKHPYPYSHSQPHTHTNLLPSSQTRNANTNRSLRPPTRLRRTNLRPSQESAHGGLLGRRSECKRS